MSGARTPEPSRIDAATLVHTDDGPRWSTLHAADPRPHNGWLVWGGGTFAGAERLDEALRLWRAAVKAGWR